MLTYKTFIKDSILGLRWHRQPSVFFVLVFAYRAKWLRVFALPIQVLPVI